MANDDANLRRLFERVGRLYRVEFLERALARHRDWESNPWDGLALFLDSYAFEHQGRNPSFGSKAVTVMRKPKVDGNLDPSRAWNEFKTACDNKGLNVAVNPMAPRGTEYDRERGTRTTKGKSAVEVAADEPA